MEERINLVRREIPVDTTDAELAAYSRAVRGLPIGEHRLGDEALQEELRAIIEDVFVGARPAISAVKGLADGNAAGAMPAYFLLKGLRFDRLACEPEADIRGSFVVGLSSFWGKPALGSYYDPNGKFAYRHVKARPVGLGEPLTLLNSTRDGFAHTDSAFKPRPEPLFALFMARPARDGGDTLIWSARALADWIGGQPGGSATLEMMRMLEVPFVGSVLTADKVIRKPILIDGSNDRIRYKRDAIEDGAKALGRSLTSDERHIMDTLDEATRVPDLTIRFGMNGGDAVVLDNHRTLHSRSAYADVERHVLKTTLYTN